METLEKQQEEMMNPQPRKEHLWLQRLVGDWTFEGEARMAPDQPYEKFGGTESVRAIGDLWILAEGHTAMHDGGEMVTMMTLGFDPLKNRFVGSFVASRMMLLWVYEGDLDPEEKVLTLNSESPSPKGDGTLVKSQDVIEIKSDDHRVMRSLFLGDDGQWHEVMAIHYYRRK